MYFVLLVFVLCFLCLDIYRLLYFNCKFVRLSHSFIKGYLLTYFYFFISASLISAVRQPI